VGRYRRVGRLCGFEEVGQRQRFRNKLASLCGKRYE
jgi:hypothetical protein